MREYLVVYNKDCSMREAVIAESPKRAVETYARKHNIPFTKIEKVTRKVLDRYNIDSSGIDEFVNFTVTCDSSFMSGGMYRII